MVIVVYAPLIKLKMIRNGNEEERLKIKNVSAKINSLRRTRHLCLQPQNITLNILLHSLPLPAMLSRISMANSITQHAFNRWINFGVVARTYSL